jgi:hypothetical protein
MYQKNLFYSFNMKLPKKNSLNIIYYYKFRIYLTNILKIRNFGN